MQELSNLVSQQWSTPPRIILIKFHQNQPKIAPVLEKSTLLADFALAPFEDFFKDFEHNVIIKKFLVPGLTHFWTK